MFSKKSLPLFLLLVVALIAAACAGTQTPEATEPEQPAATEAPQPEPTEAPPPSTEEPVEPVMLRVGWGGSPDTLNPGTAVLSEAYTLFELVYDTMFDLNLDG
ncbi:MAG TPA: hypothetical protein VMW34_15625, partial [Anaerolineales bacterium]|nr:hypothetical protein [Anaerolineales bacterium]